MGTLLKFAVLLSALVACIFVFPVWFPKLATPAFHLGTASFVSWGILLTIVLIGGGAVALKASK